MLAMRRANAAELGEALHTGQEVADVAAAACYANATRPVPIARRAHRRSGAD